LVVCFLFFWFCFVVFFFCIFHSNCYFTFWIDTYQIILLISFHLTYMISFQNNEN
jgi:hypothetical protein